MSIPLPNGTGWCSCELINNTDNDYTPYVLTADHCIDEVGLDAINNNNASQWIFYWEYERTGCSNSGSPTLRTTTGATVVANNSVSDFALLLLTQNPRNVLGVKPYYLGWDRSGNAGTGGVGIHHPVGDVKKISVYTMTPQSTAYVSNSVDANANHWRVVWTTGTTEGGSSGSPLINSNRRIIGQLHGGYASCSSLSSPDWYGKFSVSWTGDGETDNRRKLQPWLDPAGTDPLTLNGSAIPTISGPAGFCDQATFTVNNLPSGATVQWRSTQNKTGISSGQGTASAVFVKYLDGYDYIKANVVFNGDTVARLSHEVYVGRIIPGPIDGSENVPLNTRVYYFSNPVKYPSSYQDFKWVLSPQ